jgi:hypothetical protein
LWGCGGCLFYLSVFLFNVFVGAWSVNYLLAVFFTKTIPFWGAALIGLFVAELSVPVAIVVWLLQASGVL